MFDVPLQYFLPSKSIAFEVPEAGFWSEDPISNAIYFLKFDTRTTELFEFDTFNEFREARFNSLKPSFSLTGTQLFFYPQFVCIKGDLLMSKKLDQTARINLILSASP